jgi:hypothetical protein
MERAVVSRCRPTEGPRLFILGLPRSGTTLVYQYIAHRLQVAWLTNGVGRFPYAPCLATWFQVRTHRRYRSDFSSRFGKVSGAVAPREAGGFWGRFFHPDRYQGPEEINDEARDELRRTISCIERIHRGRPFINKNVKHMQRLGALAAIFPDARFLVISRRLPEVALSLYRARQRIFGDPTRWYSVRPPDYEALRGLKPAAQVAGQLRSLVVQLENDLGKLPEHRVLRLDFEVFCLHPDMVLDLLAGPLGRPGTANKPVQGFDPSIRRPRNREEERLLAMVDDE